MGEAVRDGDECTEGRVRVECEGVGVDVVVDSHIRVECKGVGVDVVVDGHIRVE